MCIYIYIYIYIYIHTYIYIIYTYRGPDTLPCGTPLITLDHLEHKPLTLTLYRLFDSKNVHNPIQNITRNTISFQLRQ